MNRKIVSVIMVLFFSILSVSSVHAITNNDNIRVPDSFAVNGLLPDGTSIYNEVNVDSRIIVSNALLAKEYIGDLSAFY